MRPSLPLFKKTKSSKQWLGRQFSDPYVRERMASPAHYRSRSAFKLLEMDAQYNFISNRHAWTSSAAGQSRPRVIVDLGAAPGGWSQVVALKCGYAAHLQPRDDEPADMQFYGLSQSAKLARRGAWSDRSSATAHVVHPPASDAVSAADGDGSLPTIIALDLLRISPIPGVHTLQADFLSPTASELIRILLPRPRAAQRPDACVDLLLSDMAANVTGNPATDVAHSLQICDAVVRFAEQFLTVRKHAAPGGTLVLKYFMHPDTQQFCLRFLQPCFRRVYQAKPPSSRPESPERYWICIDWLGDASRRRDELPRPPIPIDTFQQILPVRRRKKPSIPQPDVPPNQTPDEE
ncbi:FtsJ-like methyltransferase-domain-containing protein [Gautieria morchelliformis]|nr:FtsJ-like methyltransferase-domain-containing protein [Gautieria morchelliformis]